MSDFHGNFSQFFGGLCTAPKTSSGRLLELAVSGEVFGKLLRHWKSLPANSRAQLRGLTVSRESTHSLVLLLEIAPRAPFVVLNVASTGSHGFPPLSEIWAHSSWWESELAGFEHMSFPLPKENLGVTWRRA